MWVAWSAKYFDISIYLDLSKSKATLELGPKHKLKKMENLGSKDCSFTVFKVQKERHKEEV